MAIALSQEELVQQWENFFRDYYKDRIEETALAYPEERSLVVDYKDIDLRDITLAEHVLENPVAAFVTAERALRLIDVPVEPRPRLRFRVTGLPESAHIQVRSLRSAHLGKLVAVQGLIKKVTEVRPKLEDAAFRCSLCGCVFRHPQQGELILEEPEVCPEERGGCGRNARFKVINEQSGFVDHQKVEIQESPEGLKGGSQPERLSVYVEDDMVGLLTPGDRVTLNIVMRSQPRRQGMLKLTEFAKVGDLVSIEHEQHDFDEVEIEPEDEQRIIELAQNPHIYETLRKSFAPTIFGLEREKDALIMALFGGVAKKYPDGSRTRGDIHLLMIGDPGTGKCVHGDTRVPLATGEIVPIRELVEEALKGEVHEVDDGWWAPLRVPVLSMDARGRIVAKRTSRVWKRTAPKELLCIRTATGREIMVTPSHPLFMTDGLAVHPRKAGLLHVGDHIALPRRRPLLADDGKDLFCDAAYVQSRSPNALRFIRPRSTDEDFWRFAGLVMGDGNVTYRPQKEQWWIEFTNETPELNALFKEGALRMGLNPGHAPKQASRGVHCWASGVEASSFLKGIGMGGTAAKKKAPSALFSSPLRCQIAFLSGLFDADAHFNEKRRTVEYYTASRALADDVAELLQRLGVRCSLQEKPVKGYTQSYWRVTVGGKDAEVLCGVLRPLHPQKIQASKKITQGEGIRRNSNIDVVPVDPGFLRELRTGLGLSQDQLGVPRGTLLGVERGEKHPTRPTFSKIAQVLASAATGRKDLDRRYLEAIARMAALSSSDLFWDRIVEIESMAPDEGHVYDLEVPDTHNFLANGIVNHNSQLLRYVSKLAPRSIYTSGKSASAAGLCVAPDTLVTLSSGEMVEIGAFTEERMKDPEVVEPGVWRQWTNSVDVETLGPGLRLKPQGLQAVWRLLSPSRLLEVVAESGRRITVSADTPLPVRGAEDGIRWVKARELTPGTPLATPRRLPEPQGEIPCILDLLGDAEDCIVGGTEPFVKRIADMLREKYGSLREACNRLGVSEDSLYSRWVNEKRRGRPSLGELVRLAQEVGFTKQEVAASILWYSQRAGHRVRLPSTLTKDLLYLVGLLAADGCIWEQKNGGVAIRFSSSDPHLMDQYVRLCQQNLGVDPRIASGSSTRPADARFHSRLFGDILARLGVPRSPKSHRVDLPPVLQRLPNDHLAAYLRGLFDGDGSCNRHSNGGSSVEFYSTSRLLVDKLQVLLLRYGIQARIRTRKKAGTTVKGRNGNSIRSRHDVHVIMITDAQALREFHAKISFGHPEKQRVLEQIVMDERRPHSNVDGVPAVGAEIRAIREVLGLSRSKLGVSPALEAGVFRPSRWNLEDIAERLQDTLDSGDHPGRRTLLPDDLRIRCFKSAGDDTEALAESLGVLVHQVEEWTHRKGRRTRVPAGVLLRLVRLLKNRGHSRLAGELARTADLTGYQAALAALRVRIDRLRNLAASDVHWDSVKEVNQVEKSGPYIYDLTVAGTHNFVANGLLAHNTAAAVRDEFGEGQWTLEAGALVLADQGVACIDELDKMSKEDQSAMHQAMEQQEISIAKAGIQATLKSRCSVVGGANPKMGRFDKYAPIHEQINMPPALLSRFDLIFSLKDEPRKESDEALAGYILRNHRAGQVAMHRLNRPDGQYSAEEEAMLFEKITPELEADFLRKYIAYAKRNVYPVLDDEAIELIKEYYVDLRNSQSEGLAFTARQLEAFVRLAEASARVRLSEVATVDDAKRAITIVEYYLKGVGMDPESGTFDIDMIVTGTSHTQRDRMTAMIQLIRELSKDSKHKVASREEILEAAEEQGIEKDKAEAALQQLKTKGQVYEPRAGSYRLT